MHVWKLIAHELEILQTIPQLFLVLLYLV